ncbi:MAG: class I SAM-dependent methyltransferase [Acidimicrobiales bacterium]
MTATVAERLAIVDRLLAEPPVVHPMDPSDEPVMGVWSSEPDCYRFIAERCPPGTRTLETGSGLSTALFAALEADHVCVTPGPQEAERLLRYCDDHGIAADRLTFMVESSHKALPRLTDELDLILIDGSHAFPMPALDWFYAGTLLRSGGMAIIDDLQLPAVKILIHFIERDPRWEQVARTAKWAAFRRLSSGDLSEEWTSQPFYVVHDRGAKAFAVRAVRKAKRTLLPSRG